MDDRRCTGGGDCRRRAGLSDANDHDAVLDVSQLDGFLPPVEAKAQLLRDMKEMDNVKRKLGL